MRKVSISAVCLAVGFSLPAAVAPSPVFDVELPRGVDFTLQNSPTSQKYLIETMPGGVALLDYNNDGLLDIFLVNGGRVADPMKEPENFGRHDPRLLESSVPSEQRRQFLRCYATSRVG